MDELYELIKLSNKKNKYYSDHKLLSLVKKHTLQYKKYDDYVAVGGTNEENEDHEENNNVENADNLEDVETPAVVDVGDMIDEENHEEFGQKEVYEPSKLQTYTIKAGTELYHGSSKKFFNYQNVELGDTRKIATGFFSPNIRFAADYVKGCALSNNTNNKSGETGYYIHKFKVKQDIPYIYVVTPDVDGEWTLDKLDNTYCVDQDNRYLVDGQKLNGIGFFVKKRETAKFSSEKPNISGNDFDAEFVLCNPFNKLEYVGTSECLGKRKRSEFFNYRGSS